MKSKNGKCAYIKKEKKEKVFHIYFLHLQLFFRFGSDNSEEEINIHICIYLRCKA